MVGLLIAKMRGFKKKLDMIEILTKAMIKMKRQSQEREIKMEARLKELENKIDNVEKETTNNLLRYLTDKADTSFDRKR